ncbi:hypothetical protein OESDEN_22852 [Oesophagostomum dentatum]|uniref:Uncharacterized protein n=1 Tax=Oesophagostomum dentatum TaxID=61180 RepID=A0A0B1RWR9_OESDE|nr:hypothetical protein OESDEN_22852 [Oesophagostomum dentatum]
MASCFKERRRAGRAAFDRYEASNAERKGGVLEIKNSSRGWGPRSSRGGAADEKEKAKTESGSKDSLKETDAKEEDSADHLARLFANAKKMPSSNEPREKKPPAKFDKQTLKPRRDRGKPKPESSADRKEEGGEKAADVHKGHDDGEAKGTMGLDAPLKKIPPPKRDPAERQRRREGQASRPIKKPSERLLAALGAATASSRPAAGSAAADFKSKKYSERSRRKEDEKAEQEAKEAPASSAT